MKLIIQTKVRTTQKEDSVFVLEQVNQVLKNHKGHLSFAGNRIIDCVNTEENDTFAQATMIADPRDFCGEGMAAMITYGDSIDQEIGSILCKLCSVRGKVSVEIQDE